MTKIFITPYFGEFPEWMDKYKAHFEAQLRPKGYDWLLDTDLEGFRKRVKDKLGIDYPGLPGTGKVWDYRGALGLLYQDEIRGYDFWATLDFDMVFGNINKWFTDEALGGLDVWSGHDTYVCGCFTLYRNTERINNLFKEYPNWKEKMIYPEPNGWVEQEFSRTLEQSGLRYKYSNVQEVQGNPWTQNPNLTLKDGKLYQDGKEIAFFHFRHSKRWPL